MKGRIVELFVSLHDLKVSGRAGFCSALSLKMHKCLEVNNEGFLLLYRSTFPYLAPPPPPEIH